MKTKLTAITVVLWTTLLLGIPVLAAEQTTTSSAEKIREVENKIKPKIQEEKVVKKEEIKKEEVKKEETKNRVRNSVIVQVNVLNKAVNLTSQILDKLQIRIDRAKNTGKDVSTLITLMTDARNRLSAAKTKLADVDSKKGTAMDKASFQAIQAELKGVNKDVRAAREDATVIIKNLKRFNSATNSAEKVEKVENKISTKSSERD